MITIAIESLPVSCGYKPYSSSDKADLQSSFQLGLAREARPCVPYSIHAL